MSHPIVAAVVDVRARLKSVRDANPTFMSTGEKAAALRELAAAEGQLAELRLRILADAGDLAADTAARDAAGWLAQHTRTSYADARADLRLADALDRDRPVLAAAMREGTASLAQARVIDRALTALPAAVDATTVAEAEAHLVDRAREFGPKELGRIGRRILDVVAPEIAEAAEAARLADLEAHAEQQTRLTMRRLGDGTTRISSRLPDAAATRLATYLEAYSNPRVARGPGRSALPVTPWRGCRTPSGWARRSSSSSSPSTPPGSPCTAGTPPRSWSPSPSTRSRPTSPPPTSSAPDSSPATSTGDLTGDRLTAAQARRLACTAKILPVVLGGHSLPLDLGRTRRLYNPAQRKALLIRDRTCRAEGCDIPGTWCEAHHLDPWHTGGPTDLANGVLLCSHHHHQAHEPRWRLERLPNGDHRFHPRR